MQNKLASNIVITNKTKQVSHIIYARSIRDEVIDFTDDNDDNDDRK